ncbi:hypothetical protein BJ875DRAFT_182168 [Amylocarpus encephaloides]|uniref:Uncharacterized protein n=1 Tax=Amylocarpus encephaloides TaxID=45428 RepID=A0A9P8C201_9HELO|nr:hypothetical protein BJ875DRAFT_182168 [Amylocarpus encephaloides]
MRSALLTLLAAASAVSASAFTNTPHPGLRARQTTDAAAATNSGASLTGVGCSTTFTTSAEVCTTTTNTANDISSSCTSTALTTSSCISSYICFESGKAKDSCMVRDDSLTTSGIVVAVVFALSLFGTIAVLVGMACIEKSKAKKDARERAALLGGGKKAMEDLDEAKPYRIGEGGDSGSDEPLAKSAAPPAGGAVPAIQLHQGIGALGERDEHWSNDYAARNNNI